jgi:hypothetical protein
MTEGEAPVKSGKILDTTGKFIVTGLVILIIMLIASPYVGLAAFISGIAIFFVFCGIAIFKSGFKDKSDGISCLSCGKPLKAQSKCTVCGASQVTRVTEVQLIAVASILLLVGAAYLGAASHFSETKISLVSELRESDNFRQIRIVGKVIEAADYYPEKYDPTGTIRLLVNDGTGDIYVRIIPSVCSELIEEKLIPGFGDTIDSEGALFVGDGGYMQIKVRDRDLFRIIDSEIRNVNITDLVPAARDAFEVGDKIAVEGQIQGKFEIEGFAWILDLGDQEGRQLSIFIPDAVTALTGNLNMETLYLSQVRVTGGLEWYESGHSWEIIPASVDDIEVLSPYVGDTYTILTVAQILANASAYQNGYVQLNNVTCAWHYADYLFSVTDSTTKLEISVFVDYDANVSTGFKVGDRMSVRGWVTFYDKNNNNIPDEGEWEIKIRALSSDYALTEADMRGGA